MNNTLFNETEYLEANLDVATAVKAGLFSSGWDHYQQCGKNEGRNLKRLSEILSREEKVFCLLDKTGLGLEIGPSHNPIAPKKKGFNVHTLDHATAAELRQKYHGHNIILDNIEEVDFVWHGEPFQELIGKTGCYDWIIASHVIEHVPDLISYLQQCEALLKPTGILSLVIPDRRYCFDYFSANTSTGQVLDAYAEKRMRPSHGQIFDYFANSAKLNGNIAWSADDRGEVTEFVHSLAEAQQQWGRSVSSAEYIDVHCWRFTPSSFRLMMADLQMLGLTGLYSAKEFDSEGCEFFVALSKTASAKPVIRLELLNKIRMEG
ncbi:MAG: methyltransferase domain-containing protein [Methylococcales bacterium]